LRPVHLLRLAINTVRTIGTSFTLLARVTLRSIGTGNSVITVSTSGALGANWSANGADVDPRRGIPDDTVTGLGRAGSTGGSANRNRITSKPHITNIRGSIRRVGSGRTLDGNT
jgi:hypothetical protein